MIISTSQSIITQFSTLRQAVLPKIVPLVNLVATPHFRLLQGLAICSYGLKEIFYDAPWCHTTAESSPQKQKRILQATGYFFVRHGALFAGCGVAGTLLSLHYLETISAGRMLSVLHHLDLGLFLAGCYVALRHNINEYNWATEHSDDASSGHRKRSAILGIISSLNYLTWCALLFFGASNALAFIFCAVGLSTGCWKILRDFSQ